MIMNILCYGSSLTLLWLRLREENFESQETPFFLQPRKNCKTQFTERLKHWNHQYMQYTKPNGTLRWFNGWCAHSSSAVASFGGPLHWLIWFDADSGTVPLTIFINCVLSYVVRSYALMTSYIVQYVRTQISHIRNRKSPYHCISTSTLFTHTYTHKHVRMRMQTCIHTNIHTHADANISTYSENKHTYYIPTYVHTYIHTYIHTYLKE